MSADEQQTQSQQINALQQRVAFLERSLQQAEERADLYQTLFQRLPFGMDIWELAQPDDPQSLRLVAVNDASAAALRQANVDLPSKVGQRLGDIYPMVPPEVFQFHAQTLHSGQVTSAGQRTISDPENGERIIELQDIPLSQVHVCTLVTDVTERIRAEALARQRVTFEEQLAAQRAALAELSTPLIPLSDNLVVMPLIGTVDSRRAQQVMETLLEGIAERGADIAILDITGVPIVDTQVANALIQATQAVKMLGAKVILTGIRAEVAQTLVGLGADLSAITTLADLQSGIAFASRNS